MNTIKFSFGSVVATVFLPVVAALATTMTTTEAFVATKNHARVSASLGFPADLSSRHPFLGGSDPVRRSAQPTDGDSENGIPNLDDDDDDGSSNNPTGWDNLMKDTRDLVVGDWIVAKRDVPSLGIRSGAGYKLVAIFLKGSSNTGTQEGGTGGGAGLGVEVLHLQRYGGGDDDDERTPVGTYTKYLRVYNPRDHDGNDETNGRNNESALGVVVTPEEIGLVSVRADWTEALYLAVPGFFWVFVAMSFSNYYTDRYGGSFLDAFFRT